MLTRVGKRIKANILRTLYFEYEQPFERIKDLTSAQVTIHSDHRFQQTERSVALMDRLISIHLLRIPVTSKLYLRKSLWGIYCSYLQSSPRASLSVDE
jgi:hypothetical protein